MADLALKIAAELALAPGEALALLDNNAFSTAWAALALSDARDLVASMEAAGALSLEVFGANLTMIHPVTDAIRPYPGLAASAHASPPTSTAAASSNRARRDTCRIRSRSGTCRRSSAPRVTRSRSPSDRSRSS